MKMNETPFARYWNGFSGKEKKALLIETLHEAHGELPIGLWVPVKLASTVKATALKNDSDMSKFIRAAVREKLLRSGVALGSGTGGAR